MTRPRAVVVVTGSELVRGDRTDLNGPFLARELLRLGLEPARIVIVAWTRGEPQKKEPVGLSSSPVQPAPVVRQPSAAGTPVRLIVKAKRGNCWLEVHSGSATGRILFQGTLELGQRKLFGGRKLWITLDRPENLATILNGRSRVLPAGGVKTLIVTSRGIRAGA